MSHDYSNLRLDGLLQELREGARIRQSLARGARWFRIREGAVDATSSRTNRGHLFLVNHVATLALIGITLGYLLWEVLWNAQLLETMANPGASRDEVEAMVGHGRWLAAFGLAWAFLRAMLFERKSGLDSVVNWVLFGSSIVILYAGIGTLYAKAIDSLSPATSMQAFELAAHRAWALKDDLAPERQARVDAARKDAPTVALWGLYVTDKTVATDAHEEYMSRRNGLSQDSVEAALAKYPEIAEARKKLSAGGERIAEFDKQYQDYLAKSRQVDSSITAWGKRGATEVFARATCGMLPNSSATKEDFARELTKSCVNDWKRAGQAYLDNTLAGDSDPVVYDNQGIRVRLSEVINLDERQFTAFVRDKAAGLVDEQLPTVETVKENARSSDVIASVIVPPISMGLSMLGIIANLGSALALVCGLKRFQGLASMLTLVCAALVIPTGSPRGMTQAWQSFASEHPVIAIVSGKVMTAERFLLGVKEATR